MSIFLRSDQPQPYSLKTYVGEWHQSREAFPVDYDVSKGHLELHKSTCALAVCADPSYDHRYAHMGPEKEAPAFETTTESLYKSGLAKSKDAPATAAPQSMLTAQTTTSALEARLSKAKALLPHLASEDEKMFVNVQ